MAEEREPPPIQNEPDLFGEDPDDDIFKSTSNKQKLDLVSEDTGVSPATKPPKGPEPNTKATTDLFSNGKGNDDDDGDMFASAVSDIPVKKEPVSTKPRSTSNELRTIDEEETDKFNIEVSITSPSKIGDGMNAYIIYQVNTVTNIPAYQSSQLAVKRRFSDFLGLYEKLVAKHQSNGIFVPKPPEKSTMGMAKVKMSKEESDSRDFIERRRAALERFMNHTVSHQTLRMDPDVRDFLSIDADLPKSSNTSALSAASVLKLFGKVGDAVTKLSSTIQETDTWFDDKIQLIENLEIQIRKLHECSETLVSRRQVAAQNSSLLAKALAVVANTDEHVTVKHAMSKLAVLEENVQQICEEQADSDFFTLSELLKDYLSLLSSVKDVFGERIKIWRHWKDAEATLTRKREAKAKLELAHKADKIPQAEAECKEWEEKVVLGEKEFDKISAALKREMTKFDRKRSRDFKANIVNYLEKLLNDEEQLVKYWEAFIPEAKAIA